MKTYLKLLAISAAVLLLGWTVSQLMLAWNRELVGPAGTVFLLSKAAALALEVVLALRWGRTGRERLVCILLMPTNYAWLWLPLLALRVMGGLQRILQGIRPDFG